jgi:hypothetical protein
MTRPFNVSTPRKRKDGKTFWLKVGAAWSRDDGGFKVDLDALPLPDAEGKVTLLISPPREEGEYTQARAVQSGGQAGSVTSGRLGDIDDEIPF